MTGSWRTTLLGWLAIIAAVVMFLTAVLDGNPDTVPNWELLISLLTGGGIGLAARDNKVTSEQVSAGK